MKEIKLRLKVLQLSHKVDWIFKYFGISKEHKWKEMYMNVIYHKEHWLFMNTGLSYILKAVSEISDNSKDIYHILLIKNVSLRIFMLKFCRLQEIKT